MGGSCIGRGSGRVKLPRSSQLFKHLTDRSDISSPTQGSYVAATCTRHALATATSSVNAYYRCYSRISSSNSSFSGCTVIRRPTFIGTRYDPACYCYNSVAEPEMARRVIRWMEWVILPRVAMLERYRLWLCVCLSVSLPEVQVLPKALNIGSRKQDRRIAH